MLHCAAHTREAVASVYVVAPPHSYMGDQARHFAVRSLLTWVIFRSSEA